MDLVVVVAIAEFAVAGLACAWLGAPSFVGCVNRPCSKAGARLAAEVVRIADTVLEDAERTLQQLSAPQQMVLWPSDLHKLQSCRRRLEALLSRAAYLAGRSNELLVSPRILRTPSGSELMELLRINLQHITSLREAADDEIRHATGWIDRGWAATHH